MVKKVSNMLNQLPPELSSAFTNRLIINVFIVLLLCSISIYMWNLKIFLFFLTIIIALIAATICQLIMMNSGELLYVCGTIIEKQSHFGINEIALSYNEMIYIVNTHKRLYNKLSEGMELAVYAMEYNIREKPSGEISIANAMYLIPHYKKNKKA